MLLKLDTEIFSSTKNRKLQTHPTAFLFNNNHSTTTTTIYNPLQTFSFQQHCSTTTIPQIANCQPFHCAPNRRHSCPPGPSEPQIGLQTRFCNLRKFLSTQTQHLISGLHEVIILNFLWRSFHNVWFPQKNAKNVCRTNLIRFMHNG